jgi:hypothetical protein
MLFVALTDLIVARAAIGSRKFILVRDSSYGRVAIQTTDVLMNAFRDLISRYPLTLSHGIGVAFFASFIGYLFRRVAGIGGGRFVITDFLGDRYA